MDAQKKGDPPRVQAWPQPSPEILRTFCPQFRACGSDGKYPVRGHCVLSQSPGWYMIPSIEEYSRYCTRPEFPQCLWFRETGESAGSVAGPEREQPIHADVWRPPAVGEPAFRPKTD